MEYRHLTLTPVGDDTPDYAAGDNIGGTFQIPVPGPGHGIKLQTVVATDAANQGPAFRILFFNALPTGTYTDNSAINLSAADIAALVGQVKIVANDYETTDSYKIVDWSGLQKIMGASARIIYGALVADAAYNGAASNDLQIHLGWEDARSG